MPSYQIHHVLLLQDENSIVRNVSNSSDARSCCSYFETHLLINENGTSFALFQKKKSPLCTDHMKSTTASITARLFYSNPHQIQIVGSVHVGLVYVPSIILIFVGLQRPGSLLRLKSESCKHANDNML